MRHTPVLLKETIEELALTPGLWCVDGTVGDGGHSAAMLAKMGPTGKLLAIDADAESLARAKDFLHEFKNEIIFSEGNFADIGSLVAAAGWKKVDRIVLDLGWSSPQFAERHRGFSFEKNEPLDMRYGKKPNAHSTVAAVTAKDVVNNSTEIELEQIFKRYGEEPLSREVAQAIVEKRKEKEFETTQELVAVILAVYRTKLRSNKEVPWIGGLHPATKIFQALRIEVNQELEALKQALPEAIELLNPGGRLAVITFHSLEDRIVKHFFQTLNPKDFTLLTKKPKSATPDELHINPRSRSAKLRVVEKRR